MSFILPAASSADNHRPLCILQVSTGDHLGGAERIAWNLFQGYRARGHISHLAVGRMRTQDADVRIMPHGRTWNPWRKLWWGAHYAMHRLYGRLPGAWYVSRLLQKFAEPAGTIDTLRGIEDFHFPGTWQLPDLFQPRPDVIHCHNLHGRYFDLRALPWLSRQVPLMLSLHDAWLLSGHCAHSFDCERWKSGCGDCPDLGIYPALLRDGTAFNLRRKAGIYENSRLYVTTACRWLMDKAHQSVLARGIVEARIIPYGIDLTVFRQGDQAAARAETGLPQGARVMLFSAFGIRKNIWKDYQTMREAAGRIAVRMRDRPLIFVALGEGGPNERIGEAEVRFVPHENSPGRVATYYQAADVYLHAARADTFPLSVLEALACGTPVVATAVGGIPEQIRSVLEHPADEATGALTPMGDADAMARAVEKVLKEDALRLKLGENAASEARDRFDLQRQVSQQLDWYREIAAARLREASLAV